MRQHLATTDILAATEARLDRLRTELRDRAAELDTREAEIIAREAALLEREREVRETQVFRRHRQTYATDRYRGALDLYQRRERERGRVLDKRQAAAEPAFKSIWADIKGPKLEKGGNAEGNPNKAAANAKRRMAGYNALGGLKEWQDQSVEMQFYRKPFAYRGEPTRPKKPARKRKNSNKRNKARGR